MKKINLLISFMFVFAGLVSAQSMSTTVRYKDNLQPSLVLQLPYSTSVTEGTILKKLNEIGYDPETKGALFWKKNKIDGFFIYSEVTLQQMMNQKLDLYFKVDRKSKKEKDKSTLYLLVSKGYDNFISPTSDSAVFRAAKKFLNSFVSESAEFKLNLDIEAQEETVKDAEKKLNQLEGKEADLIKKIEQLNKDLVDNKVDQENQKLEIENQKIRLDELRKKAGQ
jgi:hypothetical protein